MRSPQTVLETLRKHAQKAHYQYERLYRNLYNPQLYLLAYQNLYANKGSTTAGADGATLSGMSLKRIESLIKKLRDRSYQRQGILLFACFQKRAPQFTLLK